jgi:hypothetical protein
MMKKIIIEITDEQHEKMNAYLEKCFNTSISEETMDDYSLKLQTSIFGSTLDLEMYGKIELGDVTWKIED